MSAMTLSGIYRYPIKSARGHALKSATMERFGLAGDRRWMLVDSTGKFVSQRSLPTLALLDVEPLEQGLRLSFQGHAIDVAAPDPRGERVIARVWDDTVAALVCERTVNDWLSQQFDEALRLVYYPDDARRGVEPGFAPTPEFVGFADGFPLLVISQAALDALNERLPQAVPMDRFRPNLVVSGTAPHAEDQWRKIRIGSAELSLAKPCSRCAIPSINQASAERDPYINRELASYRRRDGEIYFGMNAIAKAGAVFKLGDPVDVLD